MSKLKNKLSNLLSGNARRKPKHRVEEGPQLGWSAADLSPDELVDDDWIRANTKAVK